MDNKDIREMNQNKLNEITPDELENVVGGTNPDLETILAPHLESLLRSATALADAVPLTDPSRYDAMEIMFRAENITLLLNNGRTIPQIMDEIMALARQCMDRGNGLIMQQLADVWSSALKVEKIYEATAWFAN